MIGKINLIVSPYAPLPRLKRPPVKGPYYQRRLRRLKQNPKNWTEPEVICLGDRWICHPAVYAILRQKISLLPELE